MTEPSGSLGASLTDYRDRLRWLGQLRWWAMLGAMVGIGFATALNWTFVNAPAVAGGVATVVLINLVLVVRSRRVVVVHEGEVWLHTATDLAALTWMLAWAGGISNPLIVFFAFHVVLGALLTGRSGTLVALCGTVLGLTALLVLEWQGWLPSQPLEQAPTVLSVTAIVFLVGGLGYFALHLSGRLLAERKLAVQAQTRAESSFSLLTNSLDRLNVGLDVWSEDGQPLLSSPFARRLRKLSGDPPLEERTQFAVSQEGEERLFDVVTLKRDAEAGLKAVLYVDRTEARLVEERHFMLERLATLGRALQGVAHELNTPLTTMQTLAKDLSAALADVHLPTETREDVEESLGILIDESRRCRNLTQSLLSTAHDGARGEREQSLLEVVRRAVRLVGLKAEGGDQVAIDVTSLERSVPADADRILQIMMNLVQNALKATEHLGGKDAPHVRIFAEEVPFPEQGVATDAGGSSIRIYIDDKGRGLPPEVRARLFEPFVTTRPTGEGTGLGLYTSHRIAHELGGDLTLLDGPNAGTRATLTLPKAAGAAHEHASPERVPGRVDVNEPVSMKETHDPMVASHR